MEQTVLRRSLEVNHSRCGTRAWINNPKRCVARISLRSGYEVYDADGFMASFKSGTLNAADLEAFRHKVYEIHGVFPAKDIVAL